MNNFLSHVNDFLYSYILIFLLVGAGIYFSIRTRFVQLTLLKDAFLALKEKSSDGENASGKPVSSFQALMISTASRVGTGNIAGIATALAKRWSRSHFLDVDHGSDRRSFCICGKYACTGI